MHRTMMPTNEPVVIPRMISSSGASLIGKPVFSSSMLEDRQHIGAAADDLPLPALQDVEAELVAGLGAVRSLDGNGGGDVRAAREPDAGDGRRPDLLVGNIDGRAIDTLERSELDLSFVANGRLVAPAPGCQLHLLAQPFPPPPQPPKQRGG